MSATTRTIAALTAGVVFSSIAFAATQMSSAGAVDSDESTFVPITPCRLFDTRPAGVGTIRVPIPENTSRIFQVTGSNGECTIPAGATAVSINLTGVEATTSTNLRMYPGDGTVPNAAVLNLTAGQSPTPNKIDVKLSDDGRVAVYNRFGSVNVIGDVMGYYRNDGLADLEARLAALEASQPLAVGARSSEVILGQLQLSPEVPTSIVSLDVTPLVDGQLTVNSTTHVDITDVISGATPPWTPVQCSINAGSTALDAAYLQELNREVNPLNSDQLSGTRVFDVDGGVTTTVHLTCRHDTLFTTAYLRDSVLTAVFTPSAS